ncbi:TraB/GumN family protein [Brassicibacter mesophilus]|uniref:TraB/GumN family protein n=1 Tax=Brassicibacter mesophilus TaxID=745119 RepID=UPI003D1EF8CF
MKRIWNRGWKQTLITSFMVMMLMLSTIMPAMANPADNISRWAVEALNEGEKYGIYPIEWYDGEFRNTISKERLESLLTTTSNKIAVLNLEKNDNFTPAEYTGDGTRGDVLKRFYNIVAQYKLPQLEGTPIDYLQKQHVVLGMGAGLHLDQPCTTEQAVIFATRLIEDTYNQANAGSKGLVWKVENDGNVVYLLGSIHIGSSDIYPIDRKLKGLFNSADALVVEANILNQAEGLAYFMQKSMFQDDTTLKDVISEELYEKVLLVFEKYGIDEKEYSKLKPWSLANNLNVISMSNSENMEQGAQSAGLGIDMYFIINALLSQKPIDELEGIQYQADMFDGLSQEFQEEYLTMIVDNILSPPVEEAQNSSEQLDEWLDFWRKGDVEGFSASFTKATEGDESELTKMLFGIRDEKMADKISQLLESEEKGTYFIVVGAGHLAQPNTILHNLEEKGYTIEILK